MLYEISRMVLPTGSFINYTTLFINKEEKAVVMNGSMRDCNIYKFNTWMNMFAAKKYCFYCELGNIYLKLHIEGVYKLLVTGSNKNAAFGRIDEILIDKYCSNDVEIEIPNAEKYEDIFYTIIEDKNNPITIKSGAWCTDKKPQRDNKIAIVMCTFKREEYVYKNIKLFKLFIQENPKLSEKIKFYLVDNGKTIDKNIEDGNIRIFQNKNTGGAGGFTRGIIEAKNSGENFTRILLMDDDVEVFPESFYRTLKLADYLKDEYRNSFIGGAMLNLYEKNMFYENTAIQNDNWVYSYHGELDISLPQNIATANHTPKEIFTNKDKKVSSAWWYCSFSMESVLKKGLPLPVFFRCDDLEWSWRNFGEHHISVNGISVWHSPFEWRVSKPVEYYFSKRNIIMVNILHTENYKRKMLKMLKKDFKRLIKTYDYTSCEIYLRMMKDLLQGGKTFRRDPEITLKETLEYTKNDVIEDTFEQIDRQMVREKYLKFKSKRHYMRTLYFIKKIAWLLSLRAKLIPEFLWRSKKNIWTSAPQGEFLFCKKLCLLNLFTNKAEIRAYNSKKRSKLQKEFNKLYKICDKNYALLKEEFDNSYKDFITEEFWKNYLGLQ